MITERQEQVYQYILGFREEHGIAPTHEEIRRVLNLSSKDMVSRDLQALEDAKLITREKRVARGLRVLAETERTYAEDRVIEVPLLGRIAAGRNFRLPDGNAPPFGYEDTIAVTADVCGKYRDLFALEVEGDSMVDALVADGDIVLVRSQRMAENGEMVAAWIRSSEETTLKYFYHEGNRIRLQPANRTMEPWYVAPQDVEVDGKVVAVLRRTI
jgi:repressor LexA